MLQLLILQVYRCPPSKAGRLRTSAPAPQASARLLNKSWDPKTVFSTPVDRCLSHPSSWGDSLAYAGTRASADAAPQGLMLPSRAHIT